MRGTRARDRPATGVGEQLQIRDLGWRSPTDDRDAQRLTDELSEVRTFSVDGSPPTQSGDVPTELIRDDVVRLVSSPLPERVQLRGGRRRRSRTVDPARRPELDAARRRGGRHPRAHATSADAPVHRPASAGRLPDAAAPVRGMAGARACSSTPARPGPRRRCVGCGDPGRLLCAACAGALPRPRAAGGPTPVPAGAGGLLGRGGVRRPAARRWSLGHKEHAALAWPPARASARRCGGRAAARGRAGRRGGAAGPGAGAVAARAWCGARGHDPMLRRHARQPGACARGRGSTSGSPGCCALGRRAGPGRSGRRGPGRQPRRLDALPAGRCAGWPDARPRASWWSATTSSPPGRPPARRSGRWSGRVTGGSAIAAVGRAPERRSARTNPVTMRWSLSGAERLASVSWSPSGSVVASAGSNASRAASRCQSQAKRST